MLGATYWRWIEVVSAECPLSLFLGVLWTIIQVKGFSVAGSIGDVCLGASNLEAEARYGEIMRGLVQVRAGAVLVQRERLSHFQPYHTGFFNSPPKELDISRFRATTASFSITIPMTGRRPVLGYGGV